MPSYQYEALRISNKKKMTGIITADNEKEARERLREQDLIPTRVKPANKTNAEKKADNPVMKFIQKLQGVGLKDKITFTRNMSMMVKAGIPLTEGLMYFENYCHNPVFREIIAEVRRDILSGYSFSQALAKHSKLFPESFITVTEAGEKSGELEETLNRLTELMIKQDKLKGKVISASVYPLIVLCIMGIVMLIMFLFVIPTFVNIYKQMGVTLPLITLIMVWISDALRGWWFVSFPMLGVAGFGIFKFVQSTTGRCFLDKVNLKIPVLNELVTFLNNSQFISTLHVSFSAGLPIMDALYYSIQTVNNTVIHEAFKQITEDIQTGKKLAAALSDTGHVPDIILLMISIGEESGELEKMLGNSFDYLEEEINQRVEVLTALIEPLMLLVLGAMVCALAISIYLPLYSMYEKFS